MMKGLTFFILTLMFIISTTDGLRQCKCSIPCSNKQKTSCPPGYRCSIRKKRTTGECVKSDYLDTCFQVGLARLYNGKVSKTVNGKICQRWDTSSPHKPYAPYINAAKFPERSVYEASNYCRDPGNFGRPWCYTTDPDDRWDYCAVPACSNRNCYRRGYAFQYQGTTDVTKEGLPCERWDLPPPYKRNYRDPDKFPDKSVKDAENFCRSPSKSATPWCYTTHTGLWKYCDIEECPYYYCYDVGRSWMYSGTKDRTQSGLKCQNWDKQLPHKHNYGKMPHKFPEGSVSKAKNYCRDPSWSGRPWCYTTEAKRWEYCCVDKCSDFN